MEKKKKSPKTVEEALKYKKLKIESKGGEGTATNLKRYGEDLGVTVRKSDQAPIDIQGDSSHIKDDGRTYSKGLGETKSVSTKLRMSRKKTDRAGKDLAKEITKRQMKKLKLKRGK